MKGKQEIGVKERKKQAKTRFIRDEIERED